MVGILAFIFVLGLIIIIHELGHFYFARRAGVLCHEFSFGMGPVLWQTKKGETMYSIRAIPIGGYVMMAGEDQDTSMVKKNQEVRLVIINGIVEKVVVDLKNNKYKDLDMVKIVEVDLYGKDGDLSIEVDNDGDIVKYPVKRNGEYIFKNAELMFSPFERSIESKSKRQRFLAIFGGPLMNFLLALVAFFIVGLLTGAPDLESTVVGEVVESGPAYVAGLRSGDEIKSINGFTVSNWDELSTQLDKSIAGDIEMEWIHDTETVSGSMTPRIIFYGAGFSSDPSSTGLIVAGISDDTLAGKAGMELGDEIIQVNSTLVSTWQEVVDIMDDNVNGNETTFTVLRGTEEEVVTILPYDLELVQSQGFELVDSVVSISADYSFDFIYAVKYSFIGTGNSVKAIADTLSLIINSDRVGVSDLAGPIGIYSITSRIASAGVVSLVGWLGLLSVNVGVINLLPIPALDGGRLIFLGIEAVTKRKINRNIENRIHTTMYFALLALFAIVTWNDLLRLIGLK